MSFHPTAIDLDTLKRLSKAMKSHSAEVLEAPLTLSQSQELLSRAMGYPDWHAATKSQPNPPRSTAEDPFKNPSGRMQMYLDLADLMSSLGNAPDHHPAAMMQIYCEAASAYGKKDEAQIIQKLTTSIKQCDPKEALIRVADFASHYSQQEAMGIRLMGSISWSHAFGSAAQRAERACDLSDYTRLGSSEEQAMGMVTKNSLSARLR